MANLPDIILFWSITFNLILKTMSQFCLKQKSKIAISRTMAIVYKPFCRSLTLIYWTSFFSIILSAVPNFVKAEMPLSFTRKVISQQYYLVKCGYHRKEIILKLPTGLSSVKTTPIEANRVERDNNIRCNDYQPPIGLTALMPSSNIGITLAEYPTFFFYIPDVNLEGVEGEFVLRNENDEQIYKKIVMLKASDSIISVELTGSPSLPLQPLEVGKSYYWVFSLLLDKVDRSSNTDVAGWIKRIEPNSVIKNQLTTTPYKAQAAIYATNGIWYEAVTTLAKLRCASPDDLNISSDWTSLLRQVELPEIADKPLSQCN